MEQKQRKSFKEKLAETKRLIINSTFFIISLSNIYLYKDVMGKMTYLWILLALIFGLFTALGFQYKNQKKNS